MRFQIYRESVLWTDDVPPCKNAVSEPYPNGLPDHKLWFVEINTLEDLLALVDEVGFGVEVTPTTLWINEVGFPT